MKPSVIKKILAQRDLLEKIYIRTATETQFVLARGVEATLDEKEGTLTIAGVCTNVISCDHIVAISYK